MADKVIGVDVGTNAVRAAEVALGAHPRLLRFGQVALPAGAVVEGEVADVAAVADALRRLWQEVGFRGKSVQVGIASARVILRIVEMPELDEADTRSALGLQLGDYVPLAPESTVFGFQPIAGPDGWAAGPPGSAGPAEPGGPEGGPGPEEAPQDRRQRLLLAAAHHDAVRPLVDAIQQAGLKVAAVDVIPAALARALAPPGGEGVGPPPVEAIVSLGAGTTLVVVARSGTPLFARTITSVSGRQCTERLAEALALPVTTAERAKRRVSPGRGPGTLTGPPRDDRGGPEEAPDDGAPAETDTLAAVRPLVADIVAEVADSLDYYSSQPGAVAVDRVVLTGGGMRLQGTATLLAERLGLPVVDADPWARIGGVPAGFEPVDLPFLAPYLPAAVGTALGGGRGRATRINLLPEARRRAGAGGRLPLVAAIVAALVVGGVGVLYWQRRAEIGRQERATEAARQELAQLAAGASDPAATSAAGGDAAAVLRAALVSDPDWLAAARRLDEIDATLGVEVSDVQGTKTEPAARGGQTGASGSATTTTAPTTTTAGGSSAAPSGSGPPAADGSTGPASGAAGGPPLGTLTITATAPDLVTVAAWLDAVGADPRFADPWVSAIAPRGGAAQAGGVQFTAELTLTAVNLVPRTQREASR